MAAQYLSTNDTNGQQQAYEYLIQGDYSKAVSFYEQAIEIEPLVKSHYWNLGLGLLLQGQEAEAQTTWMLGMADGDMDESDMWTAELLQVLQSEAERREELADYQMAWVIRQHMLEITPQDPHNLLHSTRLAIKLENLTDEYLSNITEVLNSWESNVDTNLVSQSVQEVLDYLPIQNSTLKFVEACLEHIKKNKAFLDNVNETKAFIDSLMWLLIKIGYSLRQPAVAAELSEMALRLYPNHREVLIHLAAFYQDKREYSKAIEVARHLTNVVETLPDKIFANHVAVKSLMAASGYWQKACEVLQNLKSLILSLLEEWPNDIREVFVFRVYISTFFFPYFEDDPQNTRLIQNKIGRWSLDNIQVYAKDFITQYRYSPLIKTAKNSSDKVLKIGYLSHCLKRHSVGWIARWLFQHHDKENFQIYSYLINPITTEDDLQQWFIDRSHQAYGFEFSANEKVLAQIQKDEIDILVDLDSITLDISCEILAIKPAPIQVTWLGWDASGLPTNDYFIADPYVLPDSAQDYYTEKIWRLPQTYVAVDGFEVGVPSLRRDQLDIPGDAVVYFVGQVGYKRHPDNIRLQMKILRNVTNSYLLIKGLADAESSKCFYEEIAEEEGVSRERLKFLPAVRFEAVHRANLGIADVVLDTYPYNGATTTLETLWMCVPMVTRVGQQFAARNSYTMMINAGLTEGIAWTDEEYVEWGIRLGKDAALRQQISWKLRQSRQTAPLWNAKQFTREMEKAYQQMWQTYFDS